MIGLVVVAVAGLGAFAAYGLALPHDPLPPGDAQAFDAGRATLSEAGLDVARVLTEFGSAPTALAVSFGAAGWLLLLRRVPEALALVGGMVLLLWLVHAAKTGVDRPRPSDPFVRTLSLSYPSGHSAYATAWLAAAVAVARRLPHPRGRTLIAAAVAVVVAVGATRVYLRAHYLSDVVGGVGLGAGIFALCGLAALSVAGVRHNGRRSP